MDNLIIIVYLAYLIVSFGIILRVGHVLYDSGEVYLKRLFPSDTDFTSTINKVLLIGYYLMNLGYALLMLKISEELTSMALVIEILSEKLSWIILLNCGIHYTNLLWMYLLAKYQTTTQLEN